MSTLVTYASLLGFAAAVLAVAGVVLLLWALRGDRPRGRRRCARCWYDMAGVPGLVCPECGREASSESGLRRTRRRWRWAGAGLAMCMATTALWRLPYVQAHGWPGAFPTTVLIVALPWLNVPTWQELGPARLSVRAHLYLDLHLRRLSKGELSWWQRRLLIERCLRGDRRHQVGSNAWREKYVSLLTSMHQGVANSRQVRPAPLPAANPPLVIYAGSRERHRLLAALALASLSTRQQWPVDEPLLVRVDPRFFTSVDRGDLLTFTVESTLPGASPQVWELGGGVLVPHDAGEPVAGRSASERAGLPLHVQLVESWWNDGAVHVKVLLDSIVHYPVRFKGSADEIMQAVTCESVHQALARSMDPLVLTSEWDMYPDSASHARTAVRIFHGRASELVQALLMHDNLTLGLRIELLCDGNVEAEGHASWWARQSVLAGRVDTPPVYLEGSGNVVLLRWRDGPRGPGTCHWTIRLTGDPVVSLRNFDSWQHWSGSLEKEIAWHRKPGDKETAPVP